jgi:hypothetical protein
MCGAVKTGTGSMSQYEQPHSGPAHSTSTPRTRPGTGPGSAGHAGSTVGAVAVASAVSRRAAGNARRAERTTAHNVAVGLRSVYLPTPEEVVIVWLEATAGIMRIVVDSGCFKTLYS